MADKRKVDKKKRNYASAKERIERHDSGYSPTAVKLPEGFERLVFDKKGTYRFDVIPYVVGKGNPYADEGAWWCERTYFVHRNIGPENKSYCCLAKTFKKKCPICEEIARLNRSGGDPDLIKSLKTSERQLWNVKDLNDDGKMKVLDQSNFLFGALIDAKVAASDDEDHYENYFHLEDGYTLKVTVDQDSFAGKTFFKPTNIDMKARKEDYDDSIVKEACCLDDCLVELSYEKLKSIFLQEAEESDDSEDEDEEETPKKKSTAVSKNGKAASTKAKGKPVDDDDESEDEEDTDDSDLEDDDSDEDDSELDESDDEDDDSDDEDDDSDDDEEPVVKKKPGRPKKK
jgi:hypothetical protein